MNMSPELLLYIIKLSIGGIVGFLAILLMSKTRDASWMCMVGGFLLSYAVLIFDLMKSLGIITDTKIVLFGIPISDLICAVVPGLFFIIGFILMLCKK